MGGRPMCGLGTWEEDGSAVSKRRHRPWLVAPTCVVQRDKRGTFGVLVGGRPVNGLGTWEGDGYVVAKFVRLNVVVGWWRPQRA